MEQVAHRFARRRVAHEEDRVRFAFEQRVLRRLALQVEQLRSAARLDAVRLEQRLREHARSAAFAADRDPLAVQLGHEPERFRRPVEEEHRHVEDAAERHHLARVAERGKAALDESDVHVDLRIAEAPEVLQRSLRGQDLQRDALAREDRAILFRRVLERAARRPAGHDDCLRWSRTDVVQGDPERRDHDQDEGQDRDQQVTPVNPGDP